MTPYAFAHRTAVVTGAASGIGAALAGVLATRGSDLALVDRDEPGLARTAAALRSAYPDLTVSTHPADLSETSDFTELAEAVRGQHEELGLLVNNAGVALAGRVEEVSMADIDWIMAINFRAPVALVKAFLPDLRAAPGAHITNISSLFGLLAPAGQAAYAASKFALRGFTQSLQAELIPEGIGVSVIHPGGIATNIAENARIGGAAQTDPVALDRVRAAFGAHLRMPPEEAARQIVRAIELRSERLVITRQAIFADRIARLFPVRQRLLIARAVRR